MKNSLSSPVTVKRPARALARRGHLNKQRTAYALIAPALILLLLIQITPILVGAWMSTVKLTQFFIANWQKAPFAGLDNYRIALDFDQATGAALLNSFVVTCGYTLLVVGISWTFGMAGAVALQRSFVGRGLLRTAFLIPYAVPMYAGIIVWKFILQKDTGALNHILSDNLHLFADGDKPFWLLGSNAFIAIVMVGIWPMWPFAFLMLMAGLQSIPNELYEASAIDGAKAFRQWRSITLPMLAPINRVLLLVLFLWIFNDFNTPFILFGASEPPAADLMSFHIYSTSFVTLNFGLGSAKSVLLVLFLLLVTAIYLLIANRKARDERE